MTADEQQYAEKLQAAARVKLQAAARGRNVRRHSWDVRPPSLKDASKRSSFKGSRKRKMSHKPADEVQWDLLQSTESSSTHGNGSGTIKFKARRGAHFEAYYYLLQDFAAGSSSNDGVDGILLPRRVSSRSGGMLGSARLLHQKPEKILLDEKSWNLKQPELIVWATGQDQRRVQLPAIEDMALRHGLKRLARTTDAWFLTDGLDDGVSAFTGEVLGGFKDAPCIGIVPLHKVIDQNLVKHQQLYTATGTKWSGKGKDSGGGDYAAALERHHTHFLLLDSSESIAQRSRREAEFGIAVAAKIRDRMSRERHVPLVTLVIGGGVHSLVDVLDALDSKGKGVVVLVRESGGCAQVVAEWLEDVRASERTTDEDSHTANLPAMLQRFLGKERVEKHLIAGVEKIWIQGEPITKGDAKKQAAEMLLKIGQHPRQRRRCKIYRSANDGTGTYNSRTSFDTVLLEAVVDSITFDADMDETSKRITTQHAGSAKLRPVFSSIERLPIMCRQDDRVSTKYPKRLPVAEAFVGWGSGWESGVYEDVRNEYTYFDVLQNSPGVAGSKGWADPIDARKVDFLQRLGVEGASELQFDAVGRPLHPKGRTGLAGRGSLAKWGPNQAMDSIVTRVKPKDDEDEHDKLQLLAERRIDFRHGVIGAFRRGDEVISHKVLKAKELAMERLDVKKRDAEKRDVESGRTDFERLWGQMMQRAETEPPIYDGYVDDPRTTDHAWINTKVTWFHMEKELADLFGDPPQDRRMTARLEWIDADRICEPRYRALYGMHRTWVSAVKIRFLPHQEARSPGPYPGPKVLGYNPKVPGLRPERTTVPDEKVSWDLPYPEYAPTYLPPKYDFEKRPADPWEDAIDPETRGLTAKQLRLFSDNEPAVLRLRGTYEVPLADRTHQPPSNITRNPRGRTGAWGLGVLPRWGPNQALDLILTRHGPVDERMQMLLFKARNGDWKMPGCLAKSAGKMLRVEMRSLFEEKCVRGTYKTRPEDYCLQTPSSDEARRDVLINELFSNPMNVTDVYRGYIDDSRNTDNAWVETTCCGYHCSRELGLLLKFESLSFDAADEDDALDSIIGAANELQPHWVDADHIGYLPIGNDHTQLIHGAVELIKSELIKRGQLLGTVTGFNRVDLASELLRNPKLKAERSPYALERVFERSLCTIATDPRFDISTIGVLMMHGAKAADVKLNKLYAHSTLAFVHEVTACISNDEGADERSPKDDQFSHASRANLVAHNDTQARLKDTKQQLQLPLADDYARMLDHHVSGFFNYATQQTRDNATVSAFDLMVWAINCGRTQLAFTFWEQSEAPLRAALIGQQLCEKIKEKHLYHLAPDVIAEFQSGERGFLERATSVLSQLKGVESARWLLFPPCQVRETLGRISEKSHGALAQQIHWAAGHTPVLQRTLLELIQWSGNQELARQPYCRAVTDKVWLGEHEDCGPVRLSQPPSILQLVLFTLFSPFLICIAPFFYVRNIRTYVRHFVLEKFVRYVIPLTLNSMHPDVIALAELPKFKEARKDHLFRMRGHKLTGHDKLASVIDKPVSFIERNVPVQMSGARDEDTSALLAAWECADLSNDILSSTMNFHGSHVGPMRTLKSVFRVPWVKQVTQIVSEVFFFLLFIWYDALHSAAAPRHCLATRAASRHSRARPQVSGVDTPSPSPCTGALSCPSAGRSISPSTRSASTPSPSSWRNFTSTCARPPPGSTGASTCSTSSSLRRS